MASCLDAEIWVVSTPDDVYSITHGGQCTLLTEWHFGMMLAHFAGRDARFIGNQGAYHMQTLIVDFGFVSHAVV